LSEQLRLQAAGVACRSHQETCTAGPLPAARHGDAP
jgi:hypothetical protein